MMTQQNIHKIETFYWFVFSYLFLDEKKKTTTKINREIKQKTSGFIIN